VVPVNATRPPMIPWPQTLPSPAAREQNRTALGYEVHAVLLHAEGTVTPGIVLEPSLIGVRGSKGLHLIVIVKKCMTLYMKQTYTSSDSVKYFLMYIACNKPRYSFKHRMQVKRHFRNWSRGAASGRSDLSLTRWSGHPGKVGGHAALAMCSQASAGVKKPTPEWRRRRLYNSTTEHPRYHDPRRW
jgi:hypothetical protein